MSDTFKLPEGFEFTNTLEEESIEEVVKDKDLQLQETTEEKPRTLISKDSKTGTLTEETIRTISKIYDKTQGKEVEEDVSLVESLEIKIYQLMKRWHLNLTNLLIELL